jgi:predicted nucleic acid-binding Zn ribbon protein
LRIGGRKEDGIAVFHPRNNQEGTTHPSNQSFCYHFCKRLTQVEKKKERKGSLLALKAWLHFTIFFLLPNFGQRS